MNFTVEGAVTYQREEQWCDDCGKVTSHVRAVRTSDNWHSDWTCAKEVTGKAHPKARAERCGR